MSDTVEVCPQCDSSMVYERATADPPWTCYSCDREFGTPTERPSRAPSAPDPDVVLGDVAPGEKVLLDRADGEGWVRPFVVMDVATTTWDVPFGADWVDATLSLRAARPTGPPYVATVRPDGSVTVAIDRDPAGTKQLHGPWSVRAAAVCGQLSQPTYLRFFVEDDAAPPPGDDAWKQVREEVAGDV